MPSIRDRLQRAQRRVFVGREDVLVAFERLLGRGAGDDLILNIQGVAGVGKSFLLAELRRQALAKGWVVVNTDGGAFPTAVAALSNMAEQLKAQTLDTRAFDRDIKRFLAVDEGVRRVAKS